MKFILGKKIEMTQKFLDDGSIVPVTAVKAGPCFIIRVKTIAKDGYKSVQIGYQEAKKLNKALNGQLKNIFKAKYLREFRLPEKTEIEYKEGQKISVEVFAKGDKVKVIGTSKGKGFQGVVRRHSFHGAPATHGNKDQLRHSGSIGSGGPQHVFKGTRMAGRMGGEQTTITNLEIIDIDPAKNILYVKGAIPGSRNGLVEISAPGEMKLVEEKVAKVEKKEAEVIAEAKPIEQVKEEK